MVREPDSRHGNVTCVRESDLVDLREGGRNIEPCYIRLCIDVAVH